MITVEFKQKSGIYKIANTIDGRCYIGSAVSLYNRYHVHKHRLTCGTHHSQHLQRFVNKYGLDAVIFEVIEICDVQDLLAREQYWIDTLSPTFNTAQIAGNTLGVLHTPASRRKMSVARKGKQTTGMLGKKHTPETKAKIAAKRIGKPLHPNFKAASIAANTGRKHSKDRRDRLAVIQSKVSRQDAREIWLASKLGVYQKDIAKAFNISQRLVFRVLHGIGIYGEYKKLDTDYFNAQEARFAAHIAQPNMFAPEPIVEQQVMFAQAA